MLLRVEAQQMSTPVEYVKVAGSPPRHDANSNQQQTIALFSSSTYNWTTHESSTTWQLLDVASGAITEAPFDSSVSEVVWVGLTNTSILYINGTNDDVPGGVTLYTADVAADVFSPYVSWVSCRGPLTSDSLISYRTLVASLDAPFQGLKAVQTESGSINFVVNSLVYWNNGSAYNPELASTPLSSGQLYDANFIRHWDTYITAERYAIFSGVLSGGAGNFSFNGEVKNLLSGLNATVTRPETPVQPFGDQGDYDISPDGSTVAFLTKAPELPKANYTASYIYLVPHDGSEAPVAVNGPGTTAPEAAKGASGAPKWSPDGTKLAYVQQNGISYESDRSQIYVATVNGLEAEVTPVAEDWDSSAASVQWSDDGADLWVASELYASNRIFIIPHDAEASFEPVNITGPDTSLADFAVLPDGSALVSAAASWTSRIFYTQAPGEDKTVIFTANEVDPELEGLKPDSVSNFWYEGGDGDQIQTFVFYPTDFDPTKKYPLAFIVHGGPQSSQADNWSTRWNLRLWADQGFIVTSPQFTGTPSYGQAFTDKIQNNWGGTPYRDLVKLFEYLEANVSYIDTDNAIAAGASYGGYM